MGWHFGSRRNSGTSRNLFIYIQSEPMNVNVVVDYVYKQYSNLYNFFSQE